MAKNLHSYLKKTITHHTSHITHLHDLAYTLQVGREPMEERLAIVVKDKEDLVKKLSHVLEGNQDFDEVYHGKTKEKKEKNRVFVEDEDFRQMCQKWIEKGKLSKLGKLWVDGLEVDWNKLNSNYKPHRISLPTYPFAKERHWIPESPNLSSNLKSEIIDHKSFQLHPLVHKNTSNFEEQRYCSTFTGEEFFLKDHVVKGQKVLPGVAYLEMARAAVEQAGFEQVQTIENVIWASPIQITDKAETIAIVLFPEHNGVSYEVMSGQDIVHSQGKVKNEALVEAPLARDLSAIQRRCKKTLEAKQLYTKYHKLGLVYGPCFQGVKTLHYNDKEVLAKIELSVKADFVLNPALLDSALQASIGLSLNTLDTKENNLYVPFALKEMTLFGPLSGIIYSHITYSKENLSTDITNCDITVLGETGEILLQLKRLTARQIALTPISIAQEQEKPTDVIYATSEWQDKPLVVVDNSQIPFKKFELSFPTTSTPEKVISTFKEAFNQVKAIIASKPQKAQSLIWTVSEKVPEYCYSPIVALLKTAKLGNPKLLGKVVVFPKLSLTWNKTIIEQEAQDMTEVEVRYLSAEQRQVKQLFEVKTKPSELKDSIKTGGIYLITGGAGGLGLIFARYLNQN